MRRALLIFGLLAGLAWGQGGGSDVEQLLTNATATGATSVVHNFQFASHFGFLIFSNAMGHTCSNPAAMGQFEFSFDSTNGSNGTWTAFGAPTTGNTITSLSQTFTGGGVFKYVRFNLTAFDTTNCVANFWYTGYPQYAPFSGAGTTTAAACTAGVVFNKALAVLPNSASSITSADTCITSMSFTNITASAATVTVTDGSNVALLQGFSIPGNSILTLQLNGVKLSGGIKWNANAAATINGAVNGAQ